MSWKFICHWVRHGSYQPDVRLCTNSWMKGLMQSCNSVEWSLNIVFEHCESFLQQFWWFTKEMFTVRVISDVLARLLLAKKTSVGWNGYRKFLIQLGSTNDGWKSSVILTRVIPIKVISLILLQRFAAGVVGSSRTT